MSPCNHQWWEHDGSAFCYLCRTFVADAHTLEDAAMTPEMGNWGHDEALEEMARLHDELGALRGQVRQQVATIAALECKVAEVKEERDEAQADHQRTRDAWAVKWAAAGSAAAKVQAERDLALALLRECCDELRNFVDPADTTDEMTAFLARLDEVLR